MVRQGEKTLQVELIPNEKGYVYLQLEKPEERLERLVKNGNITEEEAASKKANIPANLKYDIKVAPNN